MGSNHLNIIRHYLEDLEGDRIDEKTILQLLVKKNIVIIKKIMKLVSVEDVNVQVAVIKLFYDFKFYNEIAILMSLADPIICKLIPKVLLLEEEGIVVLNKIIFDSLIECASRSNPKSSEGQRKLKRIINSLKNIENDKVKEIIKNVSDKVNNSSKLAVSLKNVIVNLCSS